MNTKNLMNTQTARLAVPSLLSVALLFACGSPGDVTSEESVAPSASAGARLWEENCVRCHNLRLPDSYNDSEWRIITHHMRLRANLTGEEHRAILAFLENGF